MGSDRSIGARLATRCCYGAYFALGFFITTLILAVMFWIVWCYLGLAIVQVSDTQRRALVNYSYTTSKPTPIPVTTVPNRPTSSMVAHTPGNSNLESSINSISKSPTAATVLRGSSRGESQLKLRDKGKEAPSFPQDAKGDFASRDKATQQHNTNQTRGGVSLNATVQDPPTVVTSLPQGPSRTRDDGSLPEKTGQKAAILNESPEDESDDRIHARRVASSGPENRKDTPDEKDTTNNRPVRRNPSDSEAVPRLDIVPTQVYDSKNGRSRRPTEADEDRAREETRLKPKDFDDKDRITPSRRDEIQSSRRSDSDPAYRDPDFERDYPRRYATDMDRGRPRYDEEDDDRVSRSRYDKRDRGRESDDRYSKGDTRVYPDDEVRRPLERERSDDRYRDRLPARDDRDRYPDDPVKRGDDDRYRDRDYNDRYKDSEGRYRSRDDTDPRYRDRDDRYQPRDEKYRDDDRYVSRDDRLRSRDDDRYRTRDDDRYRLRDEDRYRTHDEDKYRPRDDERYRDRDINDKPRDRTTYLDRAVAERDKYRPRADGDRYIDTSPPYPRDNREPIISSRVDDDLTISERKPLPLRPESDPRVDRRISEYDIDERDRPRSSSRDEVLDPPVRPASSRDKYRNRDRDDDYRRPLPYDERDERISPTRTRDEAYIARPTVIDSRSRDEDRYVEDRKLIRNDRYPDDNDRPRSRIEDPRGKPSVPPSVIGGSSRRLIDDRDEYRTRLPDERRVDAKYVDRGEEVVLDRRSYASEEDDEYRRSNSRTRTPYDYEDRDRRPIDDTRRDYRDDDRYTRRRGTDDEEYVRSRPRGDYDIDRPRSRDRADDDYRKYDRDDDRYISRDDDPYDGRSPVRKYDRYPPKDDERTLRRDPNESSLRKEDTIRETDRIERPRLERPLRSDDEKLRDTYVPPRSTDTRRYDDAPESRDSYLSQSDSRRPSVSSRPSSSAKEPLLGSSMTSLYTREPSDVIIREKRFQNTQNKPQSSNRELIRGDLPKSRGDRGEPLNNPPRRDSSEERPLNAKDVIEAALRHSDAVDENSRKVYYPVFDPRVSNLTSPEIIRPSERRGTTITAKKRRKRALLYK